MRVKDLPTTATLVLSISSGLAFFQAIPALNPFASDPSADADVGGMVRALFGATAAALFALHSAINDADARIWAQRIMRWPARHT